MQFICWVRVDFKYRTWSFNCFHRNEIAIAFNPRTAHDLFKNLMILWGVEQAEGNKLKRTGIKWIVISKNWLNQPLLLAISVPGLEFVKHWGHWSEQRGTVPESVGHSVFKERKPEIQWTKSHTMTKWLRVRKICELRGKAMYVVRDDVRGT